MYLAPHNVTHSYYSLANYIEFAYKTHSLTVWPLQRRLGAFSYGVKYIYRKLCSCVSFAYGQPSDILDEDDPVAQQEAKLIYQGHWLVEAALNRFDERESMWDFLMRYIWAGRDDTEAIALYISPFCILILINRFLNRWVIDYKKDDKAKKEGD